MKTAFQKRLRLRRRYVTTVLVGGLGNQLFQFYAGEWLSKRLGVAHRVNGALSQFGRTGHSDWLTGFDLGKVSIYETKSRHGFGYAFQFLKFRAFDFIQILPERLKTYGEQVFGYYRSQVTGFDSDLHLLTHPVTVAGYFQTFFYVDHLKSQGAFSRPILRNPTNWHAQVATLFSGQKTLSLHVRRGDYVQQQERFGLLDGAYYLHAISKLEAQGCNWDQVIVFSDDPDRVQSEFTFLAKFSPIYLAAPAEAHAAESLDLMSKSTFLVIGNSTFSWWAAFLSSAEVVVRPSKWFKNMPDPELMFPEGWWEATSIWSES